MSLARRVEVRPPTAIEFRRGIELNPNTSQLLFGARLDINHYLLGAALGVTSDLDIEGLEYFIARRKLQKVEEGYFHPSVHERVSYDLNTLIAAYRQEYPEGSNRPYHIQTGITRIFTQLENNPIRGLRHRTARARLAAHEYATPWRELIQGENHH